MQALLLCAVISVLCCLLEIGPATSAQVHNPWKRNKGMYASFMKEGKPNRTTIQAMKSDGVVPMAKAATPYSTCSGAGNIIDVVLDPTDGAFISSPNHPSNYPNDLDCSWRIPAPPALKETTLTPVGTFNIHNSGCTRDYLRIYETVGGGFDERYCGPDMGVLSVISQSELIVQFFSDASANNVGFRLDIIADVPGAGLDPCNNGGVAVPVVGDGVHIDSPSYSSPYPDSQTCLWEIVPLPNKVVVLLPEYFDIQGTYPACGTDELEILYVDDGGTNQQAELYCGTTIAEYRRDDGRPVVVSFTSDVIAAGASNYFRLTVYHVPSLDASACSTDAVIVTTDGGTIDSPNYPTDYILSSLCKWEIQAPAGQYVLLTPTAFVLEPPSGSGSCSDYVEIFDDDVFYGQFCDDLAGSGIGAVVSRDNVLYLQFLSDALITDTGFSFSVTFVTSRDLCLTTQLLVVSDGDHIISPNYPSDYNNNDDCTWIIRATPTNLAVLLVPNDFDVDVSPSCAQDVLDVEDGATTSLGSFCDSLASSGLGSLLSNDNVMKLQFTSNGADTSRGFNFTVHLVPPADTCSSTPVLVGNDGAVIESPGYSDPANYVGDTVCKWRILAPEGMFLYVVPDSGFILASGDELLLTDTASGDVYGPYTGDFATSTIAAVVTTANELAVQFTSDGDGNEDAGFQLTITHIFPPATYASPPILVVQNGAVIATPDYPNTNYPDDFLAGWTIQPPVDKYVLLFPEDFDVVPSASCADDSLEVEEGATTLGTYCGTLYESGLRGLITSTAGDTLSLTFTTDGSNNDLGFNFTVYFVDSPDTCSSTPVMVGNDGANITSPNYPADYNNDHDCKWIIMAPPGQFVYLEPTNFDVEYQSTCNNDYVAIKDGDAAIGTFCGLIDDDTHNLLTTVLVSSENVIKIEFVSDSSTAASGFRFIVHHIFPTDTCSASTPVTVAHDGAFIRSPNYPASYDVNVDCKWEIHAPPDLAVLLIIDDFVLATSASCAEDYLEIIDDTVTLGTYCNTRDASGLRRSRLLSTDIMHIEFHTDGNVRKAVQQTSAGFSLYVHYVFPPVTCSNTPIFVGNDGAIITSPNYPGSNYPNSITCRWHIQAPEEMFVLLVPNAFLVDCGGDSLTIQDGTDPAIGTYCGTLYESLLRARISTSREFHLVFTTDGGTTSSGFSFVVRFVFSQDTCSSTPVLIGHDSANFTSPDFTVPDDYPNNADCKWRVQAPIGLTVFLQLIEFNVEDDSTCSKDVLKIYDNTPLSNTFCGSELDSGVRTTTIVSSANWLRLEFESDSTIRDTGFRFIVHHIFPEDICSDHDVLVVKDGTIIKSPGHPSHYPNSRQCQWEIVPPLDMFVYILIRDFDLEGIAGCTNDYLEISDEQATFSERFCGNLDTSGITDLNIVTTSAGDSMFISFEANVIFRYPGFSLEIVHIHKTDWCSSTPVLVVHDNSVIRSPEYPSNYPDATTCVWTVRAPIGQFVLISPNFLDIVSSAGCADDFLTIHDENDLVGTYCGNLYDSGLRAMISVSREFRLDFTSDGSSSAPGFDLSVKFVQSQELCSGPAVVVEYDGAVITSHNYPEHYLNDEVCSWQINAPTGQRIYLEVNYFALEESDGCANDYLTVSGQTFCGSLESSGLLLTTLVSVSNAMTLDFSSSLSDTETGFSFTVHHIFSPDTCSSRPVLVLDEVTITSPDFGSNYPNSVTCIWIIQAPANKIVHLTFEEFNLESSAQCSADYLAVYDGKVLLGGFCGPLATSGINVAVLASSSNMLEVQFITDGVNTDAGFNFTVWHHDLPDTCDSNGVSVVQDGAIITSPGYPGSYPVGVDCVWDIYSPSDLHILFIPNAFDLEHSADCIKDWIIIESNPYCGDYFRSDLRPFTNRDSSLHIEFHSDADIRSTGFNFTVYFVWPEDTCQTTPVVLLGGFMVNLFSPDYPDYPADVLCRWTILEPEHAVIWIEQITFELEDNCADDSLTIFDEDRQYGIFCGSTGPVWLVSDTNLLHLEFETDSTDNFRGFQIKFFPVYPSESCSPYNFMVRQNGAVIKSPNFPDNYPSNARCEWNIQAPPSKLVHLVVNSFLLERNAGCHKDNLTIYDDMVLLGVFCGDLADSESTLLRSLVSHGRGLDLYFKTDSSVSYQGFSFTVDFIDSPDDVAANLPVSHDPCTGGMLYITESGNFISSPNYPDNYPSFLSCNWRIEAAFGQRIRLETQDFRVEYERACIYDTFTIYDGVSPKAPLLGIYCGILNHVGVWPVDIESTGSGLYLTFESDYFQTDGGFLFTAYFIGAPDGPGINEPCSGGIEWIYMDGVTITSPGYPDSRYPDNVLCRWAIQAPGDKEVYLTVDAFWLEEDSTCSADSLTIFDGINVEADIIGRYCGSIYVIPTQYLSSDHALFVQFETDSDDTYSGFSISVHFSETGECPEEPIVLTAENSMILSPNYPVDYPTSVFCQWRIIAPSTMYVYLEPVEFSIERDDNCNWDVVEVYNGDTDSSPLIGRFCGMLGDPIHGPTQIISTGEDMFVTFTSDVIIRDLGFKFLVHFLSTPEIPPSENACSGGYVLVEEDGTIIKSPNHPGYYPNMIKCSWRIRSTGDRIIMLVAGAFSLEYDTRCSKDTLSVYDGTSTDSPIINRFCGSIGGIGNPPGDVRSSRRDMFLEFTTDAHNSFTGFIFSVEFVRPGYPENVDACSLDFGSVTEPTKIYSPNYPEDYPNNADCTWKIEAPHSQVVRVSTLVFELEYNAGCDRDYVALHDGTSTSATLLGTYCSTVGPPAVTSSTHNMVLKFVSSSSTTFMGFILIIDFVDVAPDPIPLPCGYPAILPISPRIVGGREAIPNSWPWMASLRVDGVHECSGVVINDRWILTGGNCLKLAAPCAFDVVLGDHDRDNVGGIEQHFGIESVTVHDAFDLDVSDKINDIALVKLDATIVYSDEISPVCLPENPDISTDFLCISTGWGLLSAGDDSFLQQVDLLTISQETCSQEDWFGADVTESMLCAGMERPGTGFCDGDEGAPLVCRRHDTWMVYGIGSWGGCGEEFRKPSVFTRVYKYMKWINDVVQESKISCTSGVVELIATDGRGVAATPNHPSLYPVDIDCAFHIIAPEGRRIQIFFMDFYMEVWDGDAYDYVNLYDGGGTTAPYIGFYSDYDNPGSVVSTGNQLYITIYTDDCCTRSGFSFVWYLFVEGESPRPCPLNYNDVGFGCLWFSDDLALSWNDAQEHCRCHNPGARVIEPTFSSMLIAADSLRGGQAYWIGAYYINGEFYFTGSTEDIYYYNIENFALFEPDLSGNCLKVQADGSWIDDDCSTTAKFICQLI